MATFDWPAALYPQGCVPSLRSAGLLFRGPFNGTAQTVDFVAERWVLSITLPEYARRDGGLVEATLFRLGGGKDRARCWHFARPTPLGTMRGSPTLSSGVMRGATALPIQGGTASGTLKAGDMLGCGGQLFMVRDDITLNGSGAGSVTVINRVRATIGSGSPVVWNAPTAEFIAPTFDPSVAYRPGALNGAVIDLEEIW